MSLLLQALKRAEETKRQRASGLQSEATSTAEIPTIPELAFPPLQEQADMLEAPAVEPVQVEPVLGPLELTPASPEIETVVAAPAQAEKPLLAFDIEPAPAPEPVVSEPIAAPVAVPEPVVVAVPVTPAPALILTPASAVPAASEAARQLLSAPKAGKPHSMLPWLVLGGCVLLGGLGAWFWWQFQQLTVSAPPLAAPPVAIEASAPAEASAPEALLPASAPATSSITPAVKSARKLAGAAPVLSQPSSRDAARYIEPQARTGQPLQIERRVQEGSVPPALDAAWQAYNKGDLATADTQYRRMLASDSRNRDAQLGLAAIAVRRGQKQDAARWYQNLLALNPQDAEARNGLASLDADNLPEQTEARLLQQSDQTGSARMLGQYYAANKRWHEAQQQYFMAYSQAPDNADLAFNLAVSLDHINQPKLAADYYRKALALGNGSFDRAAVDKRLAEIRAAQK